MEWLIGFAMGRALTLTSMYITLDQNTVRVLTDTCVYNKGLETAVVDTDSYKITCKDSAVFKVKK